MDFTFKTRKLNRFFNNHVASIDVIASRLSDEEVEKCREIAEYIAKEANDFISPWEDDTQAPYGISCATSMERNYLFALMTANAVKASRELTGRNPYILEMGMGTALNCVAAHAVNPNVRIVAYESNEITFDFGCEVLKRYGAKGNVLAYNRNFLFSNLSEIPFDIVVNENLDGDLVREPLFRALNAAVPYTYDGTLFVPAGLNVSVDSHSDSGRASRTYFGKIDLTKKVSSPLELRAEVKAKDLREGRYLWITTELLDFSGNVVLGEGKKGRKEIEHLHMAYPLNFVAGNMDVSKLNRDFQIPCRLEIHFVSETDSMEYIDLMGESVKKC